MSAAAAPPALYLARVMHARTTPARRFTYRVFSLLLDIDDLAGSAAGCALLSIERFNVLSFRRKDHGRRDGSELRPWVEACLSRAGIAERPDAIRLLAFPRLWSFAFNPLSIYYCYANGRLRAVVYDVRNTFGESHAYVAPIETQNDCFARHAADKVFYVSPLIGMRGTYRFALKDPGESLSIAIQLFDDAGLVLTATQTGSRRLLTSWEACKAVAGHPLMTLKVIAAIHWEALGTWLKGAHLVERPAPAAVTVSRAYIENGPERTASGPGLMHSEMDCVAV